MKRSLRRSVSFIEKSHPFGASNGAKFAKSSSTFTVRCRKPGMQDADIWPSRPSMRSAFPLTYSMRLSAHDK